MRSEWEKKRMNGFAARATIGNLLADGLVLPTSAIRTIFDKFGLDSDNAILNLLNLIASQPERLEQKTGVLIHRSFDESPRTFWDARQYTSVADASKAYKQRYPEVVDFLQKLTEACWG